MHPFQQTPPFPLPRGTRKLPINLRRTALITTHPQRTAEAISAWQGYMKGAPTPVEMPLSVLMQAWKRMEGGRTRGRYYDPLTAAGSVQGALHAASGSPPSFTSAARVPGLPSFVIGIISMAHKLNANSFPQPGTLDTQPAVLANRPIRQPLRPPNAGEVERFQQTKAEMAGRFQWQKCCGAMAEADAAMTRVQSILTK